MGSSYSTLAWWGSPRLSIEEIAPVFWDVVADRLYVVDFWARLQGKRSVNHPDE